MAEKSRRSELKSQYKLSQPEAGVYRIVNNQNGKILLGSAPNLASVQNKLKFAQSTNSPVVLDHRLSADIRTFGIQSFSLEILEVLDIRPGMTAGQIRDDLATLEELWREKQDPSLLY